MGIGVMFLLTPLLGIGTMTRLAEQTAAWWTPVCIALFLLAGVGMIAASADRHYHRLATAMVLAAGVQWLAVLLWFPAWTGELVGTDFINPLWVSAAATLIGVGLVTVLPYWAAVAYTAVILTTLAFAYSLAYSGQVLVMAEAMRAVISGGMIGVFLAVVQAAMSVARNVDGDRDRLLSAAAGTAAREARALERDRMDAVVRDEVITVLRTARAGSPARIQQEQAVAALTALEGSARERPPTVSPEMAYRRLRQMVVDYSDRIEVILEVDPAAGDYPLAAVDAMIGATSEAVVNSLQHAGPDASQVVVGQFGPESIRVRVVDDGTGFNPDRVPGDRMGIAAGIRKRMQQIPGGRAVIDSAVGDGTMVSLEWRHR